MKTYAIKTFGCQMNYSDSERVAQMLEGGGFVKGELDAEGVDLFIVNTCSVRKKAEDKAYSFMKLQKKKFPDQKIAVTGCMVRQTGDRSNSKDPLFKFDSIDIVFRIEDTIKVPKVLEAHFKDHDFSDFQKNFGGGSLETYFNIVPKVENKAQVFVPIMQGCNKFCTYCIVPYTRGKEISRPMEEILKECETLVENGAIEITLLGQNVNSYVHDNEKCFDKLLLEVDKLAEKGLSRTRFTSPHPQDFTSEVIDALVEMKTSCPYIHLPLQHGSDPILAAMNRNYTLKDYKKIVKELKEKIPETTLATDIIVGFPGESEEDFKALCEMGKDIGFDFSYTAIFSPRKNTPAEKMEAQAIDMKTKRDRFRIFDDIVQEKAFEKRAQYVGKKVQILVEKSEIMENGRYKNQGRSREYFEIWFEAGRPFVGKEVEVEITKQQNYVFEGILVAGETSGLPVI